MVVVESLGLITCERSCVDTGVRLVHRVLLSEPTHMEVEDEDQENEVEDERDGEECKVESRRVSRQHLRSP